MTLEESKVEIISAMREELLKNNIPFEEEANRSTQKGNSWLLWLEQKGGLNTSTSKLEINLSELSDGVNYIQIVAYRVRRWLSQEKNKK